MEEFTYKLKEERIKTIFSVHNPTPRSNGSALVIISLNHTSMISKDSFSKLRKCTPLPTTNGKENRQFYPNVVKYI